MKQHLPFGQFSPDAFKDVGDCEYFLEDDQDVFVFKFPNGHGARVSKPAGLYQNKINIWTLRPIVKTRAKISEMWKNLGVTCALVNTSNE